MESKIYYVLSKLKLKNIFVREFFFFIYLKSIEEDFVTWMDKFWPIVCNHYGISASEQDIRFIF